MRETQSILEGVNKKFIQMFVWKFTGRDHLGGKNTHTAMQLNFQDVRVQTGLNWPSGMCWTQWWNFRLCTSREFSDV